jgi:nucleoside 2-deoxyribosyltransferase
VSSDIANLPAGATWREEIKKQLSNCKLLIVLFSPDTIGRHWLHFEVGEAWALGRPVIPVCHSGMQSNELPDQFNGFNALQLIDPRFGNKFVESIAQHIGLYISPLINFDQITARAQGAVADRQIHKFDLFISCPMSALLEEEYAAIRPHIVDLCDELQNSRLAPRIYFSGYDKTTPADFDHPYFGSQKDFAALAESDRFLLIYPKACASGCLVEAGFAISRRIPSVYFICSENDLPFNLRSVDTSHGVLKQPFRDIATIKGMLIRHWSQLFRPMA